MGNYATNWKLHARERAKAEKAAARKSPIRSEVDDFYSANFGIDRLTQTESALKRKEDDLLANCLDYRDQVGIDR